MDELSNGSQLEQRVAESFIPDKFDMKVTINAYYVPEQPINGEDSGGTQTDAPTDQTKNADDDSEGRI